MNVSRCASGSGNNIQRVVFPSVFTLGAMCEKFGGCLGACFFIYIFFPSSFSLFVSLNFLIRGFGSYGLALGCSGFRFHLI